jgi:protein TonB
MWPVSIVVHIVLVTAALIVPLTADDDAPPPAPMRALTVPAMKTVAVPPEVIPSPSSPVRSTRSIPSVVAPTSILPYRDEPLQPAGPTTPDGPIGPGAVDIGTVVIGSSVGLPPVPPPPPPEPPPTPKIVRVGHGIREPVRIAGAPPQYPAFAREARVQGTVILEAVINERGRIERLRVLKSAPLLDVAAISAVENWRYTPTLLNGVPVSVLMTITINFTLQD